MGMILQINADTNSKVISEGKEHRKGPYEQKPIHLATPLLECRETQIHRNILSHTHMLMKLHSEGHIKE